MKKWINTKTQKVKVEIYTIFNFISSNVLSVFNTEAGPLGFLGGVQSPIISPSYLAYDVPDVPKSPQSKRPSYGHCWPNL